jgi:hypothetical protein
MSEIPIVTFGLVVVLALISLIVNRKRATSAELKGVFADLSEMLSSRLPAMGLMDDDEDTVMPTPPTVRSRKGSGEDLAKLVIKLIPPLMRVAVSLVFATAGLWIVLSHTFTPQEQHWGFTTLGTILGYWLKH